MATPNMHEVNEQIKSLRHEVAEHDYTTTELELENGAFIAKTTANNGKIREGNTLKQDKIARISQLKQLLKVHKPRFTVDDVQLD